MSQIEIENADKNIVKRRRIGNVARKVLKRNRSPVNHSKINPENFAAEMLLKHAEVQRNYGLTFLLVIFGGAALAWQTLPLNTVLIWVQSPGQWLSFATLPLAITLSSVTK